MLLNWIAALVLWKEEENLISYNIPVWSQRFLIWERL